MEREVEIARLGAQGDGVAEGSDGPLYVSFALPVERVRVEVAPGDDRAELLAVIQPSPDRVEPVCPHFGACGGCALQHLEGAAYLDWKREKVVGALRSRGLDAAVEPVRPVPLGSRRRAALALARGKDSESIGPVAAPQSSFRASRSNFPLALYASSSMAATASRALRQSTSSCSRTMSRW